MAAFGNGFDEFEFDERPRRTPVMGPGTSALQPPSPAPSPTIPMPEPQPQPTTAGPKVGLPTGESPFFQELPEPPPMGRPMPMPDFPAPIGPEPIVPTEPVGLPPEQPTFQAPLKGDERDFVNTRDFNPTGNPEVDAIRNEIRSRFPLGSSNMADPATQSAMREAFDRLIRASGGDPDALRAEIGETRFLDRMREFLGKGDTLNQSGMITIAPGVRIPSLRSLDDFGRAQPSAPTLPAVPPAAQRPAAGPTPTVPKAGRGGGGGGGVGRIGKVGEQALQEIINTQGIDEDIMFSVEQSLREALERQRQAGTETLQEGLRSRGITGAGIEASEMGRFNEALQAQQAAGLREAATGLGLGAMDRQLQAAMTAAGLGTTQRGQNVQKQIAQMQTELQRALGFEDLALRRTLGEGQLALANLTENRNFSNMLFNQGLSTAQFQHAVEQARVGNTQNLLALLAQLSQTAAGGFF